jgi:hypothetical protein
MKPQLLLPFVIAVALLPRNAVAQPASTGATATPAGTTTATPTSLPAPDAKETAVALNYCRAAFHRIRKDPTKTVLAQEQEKILNNINLDGIADHEVIVLYSSVLDEINQIGVADYERKLSRQYHGATMQRKLAFDILAIGADVATAQYGNAIRSGAGSWWDFRTMQYQRDTDLLKIDKARFAAVVQKSSQFLDTFWQMSQKKNIPDRWLVRADDLDVLEQAMQEQDAEVRLRVLKRMESFMESYPPYWYYLGRTQQELGQLFAAEATYDYLAELGRGHFRKDDMLATGLANKAAIQDYLHQPGAAETALKALEFSTDVWEANLVCARILQRNAKFASAEDAILRNLDVDLERVQSQVFLASLYETSNQRDKLLKLLSNEPVVAAIPAPVLLRCAARLGPDATPPHVLAAVTASLEGQPRVLFGPDDFVLKASPAWMLHLAKIEVRYNGETLTSPEVTAGSNSYQLRYAGRFEWGNPLGTASPPQAFDVHVAYPDGTEIQLALETPPSGGAAVLSQPARVVTSRVGGPATLRIAKIIVASAPSGAPLKTGVDAQPASAATTVPYGTEIPLPPRETGSGTESY